MRRTDQRREAVFALYQHDVTGQPVDAALRGDARPLTRALADGVARHSDELDALIERHAEGWTLERIAPLERAIMRVALLELLHAGELPGDEPIPPEGAIEEAIETAKAYCGAQAPAFVNGILGAALRDLRQNPSAS
jgi:transcription antitermination protein NusB